MDWSSNIINVAETIVFKPKDDKERTVTIPEGRRGVVTKEGFVPLTKSNTEIGSRKQADFRVREVSRREVERRQNIKSLQEQGLSQEEAIKASRGIANLKTAEAKQELINRQARTEVSKRPQVVKALEEKPEVVKERSRLEPGKTTAESLLETGKFYERRFNVGLKDEDRQRAFEAYGKSLALAVKERDVKTLASFTELDRQYGIKTSIGLAGTEALGAGVGFVAGKSVPVVKNLARGVGEFDKKLVGVTSDLGGSLNKKGAVRGVGGVRKSPPSKVQLREFSAVAQSQVNKQLVNLEKGLASSKKTGLSRASFRELERQVKGAKAKQGGEFARTPDIPVSGQRVLDVKSPVPKLQTTPKKVVSAEKFEASNYRRAVKEFNKNFGVEVIRKDVGSGRIASSSGDLNTLYRQTTKSVEVSKTKTPKVKIFEKGGVETPQLLKQTEPRKIVATVAEPGQRPSFARGDSGRGRVLAGIQERLRVQKGLLEVERSRDAFVSNLVPEDLGLLSSPVVTPKVGVRSSEVFDAGFVREYARIGRSGPVFEESSVLDVGVLSGRRSAEVEASRFDEALVVRQAEEFNIPKQYRKSVKTESKARGRGVTVPKPASINLPKTTPKIPKSPRTNSPKIPKSPLRPSKPLGLSLKSGKVGGGKRFAVFVRRRGKFEFQGRYKSLSKALNVGKSKVEKSLAASFKITDRSGVKVGGFNLGRFRSSKKEKDVFVERRRFRLSTQSEVSQILGEKRRKGKRK